MKVCEIFSSIQGESSFGGYPCVFVRLTGCNLRCSYCDTTYAYKEGTDVESSEIVRMVRSFGIKLVEITGGEPLLQESVHELMGQLLAEGMSVLLETNGSFDISHVDKKVTVILDMKTPSSQMSDRMDMNNLKRVTKKDDVKFVLSTREDYTWAMKLLHMYALPERTNVFLSPAFGVLEPSVLAEWMVADKVHARLNLQLHKYIFGPDRRGV